MKNIVICGYHGFSNSGDEALLSAMLDILQKKRADINITVLSMHPKSTQAIYGVPSVYRYNLLKINKLFSKCDLFIMGGGSLLQDITSLRSLYYYIAILKLALANKVKVMLYGNGIGPLERKSSRKLACKYLNKVDIITLRDDHSDKLLSEIGVIKPKIVITADPAFTLDFPNKKPNPELFSEIGFEGKKYALIGIRPWKNAIEGFCDTLAAFCDKLSEEYGITPIFTPMQPKVDTAISKEILSKMKHPGFIIEKHLEFDEMFRLISTSEFVVGMRLHSLIYATALGIPVIALSYDPKVTAFMQSIHQPFCVDVEKLSKKELLNMLDSLMQDLPKLHDELIASLSELRKKSEENADYAIELLDN